MLVFRLADDGIQVSRSNGDEDKERNKFELLGTIRQFQLIEDIKRVNARGYLVPSDLRESCTPQEIASLDSWLRDLRALNQQTSQLELSIAALALPETLAEAERWFAETSSPQAVFLALRIAAAMQGLEAILPSAAPAPAAEASSAPPKARGHLDRVTPRRISGWISQPGLEQPLKVLLRINGDRVLRVLADQPRPDILERGLHATGNCGFKVQLPPDQALAPGDIVHAFADPDGPELRNSPARCIAPPVKRDRDTDH